MSNSDTITGWASVGKGKPLEQMQFPMKAWDDNSVEMDITHCGICGSDVHTLGMYINNTLYRSMTDSAIYRLWLGTH